jgi:hypothetical protein
MHAGRLEEAEPIYREAFARLRRNYGTAGVMLYGQALFAALRGRVDDVVRANRAHPSPVLRSAPVNAIVACRNGAESVFASSQGGWAGVRWFVQREGT